MCNLPGLKEEYFRDINYQQINYNFNTIPTNISNFFVYLDQLIGKYTEKYTAKNKLSQRKTE